MALCCVVYDKVEGIFAVLIMLRWIYRIMLMAIFVLYYSIQYLTNKKGKPGGSGIMRRSMEVDKALKTPDE